jgi:hypothetical protein
VFLVINTSAAFLSSISANFSNYDNYDDDGGVMMMMA